MTHIWTPPKPETGGVTEKLQSGERETVREREFMCKRKSEGERECVYV